MVDDAGRCRASQEKREDGGLQDSKMQWGLIKHILLGGQQLR